MTWPSEDPAYSAPPPPPMPYYQGPYGQPPVPPKKSRKGLIIALVAGSVILGIVAVVVLIALKVAPKNGVVATDLAVGDCISTIPSGDLVAAVPRVACAEAHAGEVYAVLTIPDGGYPGQSVIELYQNKCPAELQSYTDTPVPDDSVKVFVLYPTEDTWSRGDRTVTCIATTDDQRTGSLKG